MALLRWAVHDKVRNLLRQSVGADWYRCLESRRLLLVVTHRCHTHQGTQEPSCSIPFQCAEDWLHSV